ncbi:MarR family transcriptional regulator, partial [Staphylococcus warneri]
DKLSKVRFKEDERKIYLYMNQDNMKEFNALFNDVEEYLNI